LAVIQIGAPWRVFLLLWGVAPLAYYVTAILASLRFFGRERKRVLANFCPPVSLLKPVKGADFGSYENFLSFCQQDYPDYEILFALGDERDAAVSLIRRLAAEYPARRIRIFFDAEQIGANRKVNKQIRLALEAQHEIFVLTDGDVRVGPNYLREVVAPLADARVGAVTSFYRGIAEPSLGAELEAIGASSDFFAGVLVAEWKEGMTFALGASIVTTRAWVQKIGGFEVIADQHSDDYELGHRIAEAGGEVRLSRESVWTMYPAQTARGFWEHQVRWARTVRLCRPWSYLGLIFTHGLPWTLLAAVAAASAGWIGIGLDYVAAYFALRLVMAWTVGVWGVGDDLLRRKLWLVPLRDAIFFAVWLASFSSKRITWGGEGYIMDKGQMVPTGAAKPAEAKPAVRAPR
jgi:ceramide glucosyltransferase